MFLKTCFSLLSLLSLTFYLNQSVSAGIVQSTVDFMDYIDELHSNRMMDEFGTDNTPLITELPDEIIQSMGGLSSITEEINAKLFFLLFIDSERTLDLPYQGKNTFHQET